MTWKPDVTVAAVVEREGRFLLVEERAGTRLVFNQPAGHLEPGESLVDAVIRETLEETGWHFTPAAIVGVYLWDRPRPGNDGRQRSFLRIAFLGDVSRHEADRPLDEGIERTVWLTRQQVDAREPRLRSPLVQRCIVDYLAGRRFSLDLLAYLAPSFESPAARNSQAG